LGHAFNAIPEICPKICQLLDAAVLACLGAGIRVVRANVVGHLCVVAHVIARANERGDRADGHFGPAPRSDAVRTEGVAVAPGAVRSTLPWPGSANQELQRRNRRAL
jgi:hypothetical protein